MARALLRRLLDSHLGAPGRTLLAWRTRGQAEALFASRGLTVPSRTLASRLGERVIRGPFTGLLYPRRRGDIVHAAKLLGAYESELHAPLERLIDRSPARVVNIGSGDGYYVVGLARRLPVAEIWAVDPDPFAQRACRATASLNDVSARLHFTPRLDPRGLEGALRAAADGSVASTSATSRLLCVVDCEGYEDELLEPADVPSLAHADILVETHDFARAGVTGRLAARFARTHDVVRVEIAARAPKHFPELAGLPAALAAGLVDEFRHPPQAWLVLTARAGRT